MADTSIKKHDSYQERVVKLLPAEATAAFIAINGIVAPLGNVGVKNLIALVSVVAIIILIGFLMVVVRKNGALQVAVTVIAFPFWAISIRPEIVSAWLDSPSADSTVQATVAAAMAVITIFAPAVFRSGPETKNDPGGGATP